MRVKKTEVPIAEFRVWCEDCCIRIAPHEERTIVSGKSYHPRCYSKLPAANTTSKAAPSGLLAVTGT